MSKSPDGSPFAPNITLAGTGRAFSLMPIDFSSCAAIACEVVRTAFPAVHDQLKTAGRPAHVQTAEVLGSTELGPPEQCFFRSASAFCALKFHFPKSGLYGACI